VSFLGTIGEAEAGDEIRGLYDADRARQGYVANFTRTFSLRPGVFVAWQGLNGAIKAGMDPRRYEIATLAAARRLRSSYCSLAHGAVLVAHHLPESAVRALIAGSSDEELTPIDWAIAELADTVARGASAVTEADYEPLRRLGLSDPEILDVVLAAAARCFFSTVLDATGTLPDNEYGSMFAEETRAALSVGRPIAASAVPEGSRL
jgi:uncharacterized peroxidase-related enzyme